MNSVLLEGDAARRVINATRRVEAGTNSPSGAPRAEPSSAVWAFVKVTNVGSVAAGWPGLILFPLSNSAFDPDAVSEPALIYTADAGIPLKPGYYIARRSGWDDASSRSTWQALPHCCDALPPVPSPVPETKCYACWNPAPCLELLVMDGAGWQGTVYAKLVSASGRDCTYQGAAVTPNGVLKYYLKISDYGNADFPEPGSYSAISFDSFESFLFGGSADYGQKCAAWDGALGGNWPLGQLISQVGHAPVIFTAQPAGSDRPCNTPGQGDTGLACYQACAAGCHPLTWPECIQGCAAQCFGDPAFFRAAESAGCTDGSCGCGGTCGSSSLSSSAFTDSMRFYALVDYATNLSAATVKPLYEHTSDVGNVGAGDDPLYSDTILANTLSRNGDSLQIDATAVIAAGQTATLRVKFAGITVYDSGGTTASVVDSIISVRVIVTRKTSSTARATATPSETLKAQYTPEGTLTGLNFAAPITVLVTGEGTNNNDIKAVHALAAKIPSSTTLTDLGVTTVQDLSYGPDTQLTIPFSSGDYSGAGSSVLDTGSASGTSDVDVYAVRTATSTAGQLVRVFKEIAGGAIGFEFDKIIEPRTADAKDPKFQELIYCGTVRITGANEKIRVSKEVNEGLIAKGKRRNKYAA